MRARGTGRFCDVLGQIRLRCNGAWRVVAALAKACRQTILHFGQLGLLLGFLGAFRVGLLSCGGLFGGYDR